MMKRVLLTSAAVSLEWARGQNSCFHEPESTWDLSTEAVWTSSPWVLLAVRSTLPWQFAPQYLAEQNAIKASKLLNVPFWGLDQSKALPQWLTVETCFGGIRQ